MKPETRQTIARLAEMRNRSEIPENENWRFESYGIQEDEVLVCDLPRLNKPTPVLRNYDLSAADVARNWDIIESAMHDLPAALDAIDELATENERLRAVIDKIVIAKHWVTDCPSPVTQGDLTAAIDDAEQRLNGLEPTP